MNNASNLSASIRSERKTYKTLPAQVKARAPAVHIENETGRYGSQAQIIHPVKVNGSRAHQPNYTGIDPKSRKPGQLSV